MSYNVNGLVHNCEIVTYLSENPSKIGITLYLYVKNEQGFIVLAYWSTILSYTIVSVERRVAIYSMEVWRNDHEIREENPRFLEGFLLFCTNLGWWTARRPDIENKKNWYMLFLSTDTSLSFKNSIKIFLAYAPNSKIIVYERTFG